MSRIVDFDDGKKVIDMKSLMTGITIAATLAIATPVWAQQAQPANPPNPAPHMYNPATPGANIVGPPTAPASSATIPAHHAVRHAHVMHSHHKRMGGKAALTGDTTSQLNREELARIQSGGSSR